MKTFNIMKLVAVLAMGMSLSAFGFFFGNNCGRTCGTSCAPVCAPARTECAACPGKACILKPQQVEIVKTCEHPGYYRQVCRLEYRPCEGQVTRHKACPIFEGCFEEGNESNRLDIGGAPVAGKAAGYSSAPSNNWSTTEQTVVEPKIEVISPDYDVTFGGQAAVKNNKKTVKHASKAKAKAKKAIVA